jgi:hypothetical protein
VPDKRTHRGPHPDDRQLFAPEMWPRLQEAVADLSWLWGRGYASVSAVKIVGDRYLLDQRQRIAVGRCACSDEAQTRRQGSQVPPEQLAGQTLWLDGYNVLTSVEAALGGGVILLARDGCVRDLASVHGTWRKVQETVPAIELVGRSLAKWSVAGVVWYLDRPVSNSGRLKSLLRTTANDQGWPWTVELVPNPDKILAVAEHTVATADSGILDECRRWVNLARLVIEESVPDARIVRLGPADRSLAP